MNSICPFLPAPGNHCSVLRLWVSLVAQWQRIQWQCRRCGFNPWIRKTPLCPREGNCSPLHSSCLGNPMDREAGQVTVHRISGVGRDLVIKPPPPREWNSAVSVLCRWLSLLSSVYSRFLHIVPRWRISSFFKVSKTEIGYLYAPAITCLGIYPK